MREIDPVDIVETIREGLLVLEPDLTVAFVNRAFCNTFAVPPEDAVGLKLYELGDGQWDIPELRTLLQTVDEGGATIEAFEVDRVFPSIGQLSVYARGMFGEGPFFGTSGQQFSR
jgi:PAS domain-containing protein